MVGMAEGMQQCDGGGRHATVRMQQCAMAMAAATAAEGVQLCAVMTTATATAEQPRAEERRLSKQRRTGSH